MKTTTIYPSTQQSNADVKKVLTAEDFIPKPDVNPEDIPEFDITAKYDEGDMCRIGEDVWVKTNVPKNFDSNPFDYYKWEALDGTVYYINRKTGYTISESTYRSLVNKKNMADHPSTQQSTADASLKRQAIKLGKKIQFEEKNESLKFKVLTDEDFMNLVKKEKPDMVNHPPHYNVGGLEVIDIIQAFTQDLNGIAAVDTANAIKYILRWHNKNGIEDLKKARWYIDHLIKKLEEWEDDSNKR